MGLLSWLTGDKKRQKEDLPEESLQDYSGMRVEVFDANTQELIFSSRLAVSSGGLAELQLLTPSLAHELEEDEQVHVKLRGYDEFQQLAIHLEGDANPLSGNVWRLDKLHFVSKDNDRAYYRQEIDRAGEVLRAGEAGMPELKNCLLMNISVGGACLQVDTQYQVGDRLMLHCVLSPGNEVSVFCTVCRVTQRRNGAYEYGCRFDRLDPAVEDQISRAIMQLQLRRRRR